MKNLSLQKKSTGTPAQAGYFMPPEWYPHEATWLSWPHNPDHWDRAALTDLKEMYATMIKHLLESESVYLLINNEENRKDIIAYLRSKNIDPSGIRFFHARTYDIWIRDYGPTFLINESQNNGKPNNLAYVRWYFNAWGGKYTDLKNDHAVPDLLSEFLPGKRFEPGIVFEGGSIDVNGYGLCLTTEQCLLNPNRNPECSKADIETILKEHLGLTSVIWLAGGLEGDDTDGHIDDVARFVDESTVILPVENDLSDSNVPVLKENHQRLIHFNKKNGNKLRIVTVPAADRLYEDHTALPASYVNFYVANSCVLLPVFGTPKDDEAINIFTELFQDKSIVPISCRRLIEGSGALHCITQQQPFVN